MSKNSRPRKLTSVTDTMHQLYCGRAGVYELFKSGEIESVLVGDTRKVFQDSIDAYVERLRKSAGQFERAGMRGRASTAA